MTTNSSSNTNSSPDSKFSLKPSKRTAQHRLKVRDTLNWDIRAEQARFFHRGGYNANTKIMKAATVKARRVEEIDGKKYLVIN